MDSDKRELKRHIWVLTCDHSLYLHFIIFEKIGKVPDKLFMDELYADDLCKLKSNCFLNHFECKDQGQAYLAEVVCSHILHSPALVYHYLLDLLQ